ASAALLPKELQEHSSWRENRENQQERGAKHSSHHQPAQSRCAHGHPRDAAGARVLGRLGWIVELGRGSGARVRWAELNDTETGARASYIGGVDARGA